MSKISCFEDIESWKLARKLTKEIFKKSKENDFSKDFRFKNQILSASGSIMDNIAEGFERNGSSEFKQFLSIAKGSAGEVRSQLYRAYDFGYINENEFKYFKNEYEMLSRKISNFIQYLQNSEIKGVKFK